MPLLGRSHEVDVLRGAMESGIAGDGTFVLVSGSAGIGKTRLLAEALEIANGSGLRILKGSGHELERNFPHGLARQLFEPSLAEASDSFREDLLSGAAAPARSILGLSTNPVPAENVSLSHALFWLTQNLAETGPLLMVIDDLQWADEGSLHFLIYLARRVADLPVSVMVATRQSGEQGEAREAIDLLSGVPGIESLALGELGPEAIGGLVRFVRPEASETLVEQIREMTGGNPFYLGELLAELPPDVEGDLDVAEFAPATLQRSVLLRLQGIDPNAIALARSSAMLGEDANLRRCATLAGVGIEEASAIADSLRAADLVKSTDPLMLSHALLETTILAEIPEATRANDQLRVAALLRDEHVDAERIAVHLMGARASGQGWVVEVLRRAAESASRLGAPATAAAMLQRALAEPPDSELIARVLLELGSAEALAAAPGGATRLQKAATLLEDPAEKIAALRAAGRASYGLGDMERAASFFSEALELVPPGDEELAVEIRAHYAGTALWVPSLREEGLGAALPTVASTGPATSQAERVVLSTMAGGQLFSAGDRQQALEWARRAWDDGKLLGEGSPGDPAVYGVTGVLNMGGEHLEAMAVTSQAVEAAREQGDVFAYATATYVRGSISWGLGRPIAAVPDLEFAIEASRDGWHTFLPAAYALLILTLIDLDRKDEIGERISEATVLTDSWRQSNNTYPWYVFALARFELFRGNAGRAAELYHESGELFVSAGFITTAFADWRSGLARALVRTGQRDEALELAEESLEISRRWGDPEVTSISLRALAEVQGGQAGISHLREAVELIGVSVNEVLKAETELELGEALRRNGEKVEARESLKSGLDRADKSGAQRLISRAEEELEAAGARPRRRELSGPGSLTPSELRVARMAARGMSNREIAEDLFVTIKAVGFHLGNCYRKLNIAGRKELAEALGTAYLSGED